MNKILVDEYSRIIYERIKYDPNLNPYLVTINLTNWHSYPNKHHLLEYNSMNNFWKHHSCFYRYILSNTINHYTRKRHLYPPAYCFLDLEGTRENPYKWIHSPENPHSHGVWLVHDETIDQFEGMIASRFADAVNDKTNKYIVGADAKSIARTYKDIHRVVSYSMKFVTNPQGTQLSAKGVPLVDHLPHTKSQAVQSFYRPCEPNVWVPKGTGFETTNQTSLKSTHLNF